MDDLEKKLRTRKQQARDHRIGEKAKEIAIVLGESEVSDWCEVKGYEYWGALRIRLSYCYFPKRIGVTITTNYPGGGGEVFDAYYPHILFYYPHWLAFKKSSWDIHCYKPGPWEEKLDELYLKALEKERYEKSRPKISERERKRRERAERFGL
ncbi:MAG: hypothetical protein KJ767_02875 [Nanoarchaeota archaeon]|nr:hypothetical protein [Nanoarchaeota archaeon]